MRNTDVPQWQSTDDDARPVHVHIKSHSKNTVCKPRLRMANRMPAAVFGILLFIALGIAFQQGLGGLLGQAATVDNHLIILIKEQGVEPLKLSVMQGETIMFKNESSIPHIISSQTLSTSDGEPLETTAIFPGSDETVLIPLSTTPGMYQYISTTSTNVTGTIEVISRVGVQSSSENIPLTQTSAASTTDNNGAADIDTTTSTTATGIPENPYTIGSTDNPLPQRQQQDSVSIVAAAQSVTSITQHTPESQPQTGIALWVTCLLLTASFLFVIRQSNA